MTPDTRFVEPSFWKFIVFTLISLLNTKVVVEREDSKRIINLFLEGNQALEICGRIVIRNLDPFVTQFLENFFLKLKDTLKIFTRDLCESRIPCTYERIDRMLLAAG